MRPAPTPAPPAVLSLLVLALLLGGCAGAPDPGSAGPPSTASTPDKTPDETTDPATDDATDDPTGSTARRVPAPAVEAPVTPRRLRPTRLAVPALGVDVEVVELGIADDGTIEVPTDAGLAGWLDTTPTPGRLGPAVVAGHVDSTSGPGVFADLDDLEPGDTVTVTRRDGSTASFTVDGLRTYPRDGFPTADVYGPVPAPALRLVTCGGRYDAADGGYQDNVVVYAS